mgnify:CR=1 FL=1
MALFLQVVTFLLCLPFILSQDRIIADLDDLPFSGWTANISNNITNAQVGQCAGHQYIVLQPKAITCKNFTLAATYKDFQVRFDIFTESDFFSYINLYINGRQVDRLEYLDLWTGEPLACQLKINFYQTLKTVTVNASVTPIPKSFNICFERGDKQYGTSIIGMTKLRVFNTSEALDTPPPPIPTPPVVIDRTSSSGGGGGGGGAAVAIVIAIVAVLIVGIALILLCVKRKRKMKLQAKAREEQAFPYAPKDIVLLGYEDNPPMGGSGIKPFEGNGGLPIMPAPIPMMESNGQMGSSQGSQDSTNNMLRSQGREEIALISPTVPQEGSKTLKHIVQRAKL